MIIEIEDNQGDTIAYFQVKENNEYGEPEVFTEEESNISYADEDIDDLMGTNDIKIRMQLENNINQIDNYWILDIEKLAQEFAYYLKNEGNSIDEHYIHGKCHNYFNDIIERICSLTKEFLINNCEDFKVIDKKTVMEDLISVVRIDEYLGATVDLVDFRFEDFEEQNGYLINTMEKYNDIELDKITNDMDVYEASDIFESNYEISFKYLKELIEVK